MLDSGRTSWVWDEMRAKMRAVSASDQIAFVMGLPLGLSLILLTDVFMDVGGFSETTHGSWDTG